MTIDVMGRTLRFWRSRSPRLGGIGQRLLIRVLLFSSAVTLVLTALQLYLDYSRDVTAISTRLDQIGQSNLASIGEALWGLDENLLLLQLEGLIRLPHIQAAEVHEFAPGRSPVAVIAGDRGATASISREYPIIYDVGGSEQTIGFLYVEASLSEVYRSLLEKALVILVSQGAKTFLVSFFIIYIFYRLVARHLTNVASFVGGWQLDRPSSTLALDRRPPREPDELDQVVTSFNELCENLRTTYERLQQVNLQLKLENTALAEAEAALRQSEQQFRDYTETASDWLWETDRDHRFTYLSEEFSHFGYDRRRLIGFQRWDIADDLETEPEKWRAHRAALERHEPFRSFVFSIREKDGSLHYASTSGKPIFDEDGRFLGYRGTARDITVRSLAQARVRELSIAVEQSPAGLAVVEADARLLYCNNIFLEISGLSKDDDQARMTDILPDDVWQRLSTAARAGDIRHEEVLTEKSAEQTYWALVSVAGIKSSGPGKGRLVVALQDITREKAEQREHQALQERLLLASKMEAIGRLAGGIAHDFNNLLGAMMGFSQFLVEDLQKDSESQAHAERILRMCNKGRDLVDQLLAFAGARGTERRVVDLVDSVQRCRELLDASLPSSSTLEIDLGDQPLPVLANKSQLQQILLNLCINARDAMGSSPGRIAIRLSRLRVPGAAGDEPTLQAVGRLEAGKDYALMTVSDTGIGMDAATKAQIFEPFFTTKGLGRGTGLGLAMVHGIVKSYGGAIKIDSAPGSGTTFEIYLRLENALPETEGEAGPPHHDLSGDERILVVDDDRDLVQTMTIGLNRYGYEVLGFADPVKALQAFREDPGCWDLVISDQVMPEMSGLELIRTLKKQRPELRAILYTGFEEKEIERSAVQYGVDTLLHKPITPETLAVHIRRLLVRRQASQ